MPCKRPGLRMAFSGFQTSGPVFSGCSDQVWPSGRWPSGNTGALGLRWKGSRSRPSRLQELLPRGWEDLWVLLLGHRGLPAWSRTGRWGSGAGTCLGGLERGPSTGLILTLSVGMSKAPCADQASRTTWRPWGGPCVGTGQVFWLELSRPELGAANSPWVLGSGGRSEG